MDLFGPVNVLSISRKRFCLVIMDDFSKFSWTYFLKSKDEASEIIINHIRQVNNHPDFKVRRIRSDNGTEFNNSVMRSFCEETGIMHEFSATRTPQQNGVVERKNRSLIEAARTMLEKSKLPTYFWAEAVNTACYTQNISLVNQEKCMTPYQLFKNRNPTLNFLHVFGCKCYILKNQTNQHGKFDAKADERIFVGYAVGKAYRVYNLRINIVVESIHVVFDDKNIEGLQDGDFHESLKFDNVEMVSDDSDDESDQETTTKDSAETSTTNEANNSTSIELQNASSVGRQSASSIRRQSASSVGSQSASSVRSLREAESQGRSLVLITLCELLGEQLKTQRKTPSGSQRPFNTLSMDDLIAFLDGPHSEGNECSICVVIHNIDGPGLRDADSQQYLARIAACSHAHMVASIDNVNAPLLWDKKMVHTQFSWCWYHVPTFSPYKVEGTFFPLILAHGGTTQTVKTIP
ncbi:hypothetical protein AgCh_038803 [Apium graveolens]